MSTTTGRRSTPLARVADLGVRAKILDAIALVALAFTLCGRAIESVLNPKLGVSR